MILLSEQHLKLVKDILGKYIPNVPVYAFGSRVQGNPKSYSDLDLAMMNQTPVDNLVMAKLSEAFIQSDLPFRVDLVEWLSLDKEFQNIIMERYEVIQ